MTRRTVIPILLYQSLTAKATKPYQPARPADLVERTFAAPAPNRLWVADLAYVWTIAGFAYTAFIVDAFSRRIVGWRGPW